MKAKENKYGSRHKWVDFAHKTKNKEKLFSSWRCVPMSCFGGKKFCVGKRLPYWLPTSSQWRCWMNLRTMVHRTGSTQVRDPLWIWNTEQKLPGIQNRDISGRQTCPKMFQKELHVGKFALVYILTKVIFKAMLYVAFGPFCYTIYYSSNIYQRWKRIWTMHIFVNYHFCLSLKSHRTDFKYYHTYRCMSNVFWSAHEKNFCTILFPQVNFFLSFRILLHHALVFHWLCNVSPHIHFLSEVDSCNYSPLSATPVLLYVGHNKQLGSLLICIRTSNGVIFKKKFFEPFEDLEMHLNLACLCLIWLVWK